MCLGVIAPDADRLLEAGDRLIELPQVLQCNAEVAQRLRVIRLDGERVPVAGDRLVQPAQRLERNTKAVVRPGKTRLDRKRPRNEIDRNVVLPRLMGDHPKKMQGNRLTGIVLQHPPINPLRLGQTPRRVVLQSKIHALPDARRTRPGGRVRPRLPADFPLAAPFSPSHNSALPPASPNPRQP